MPDTKEKAKPDTEEKAKPDTEEKAKPAQVKGLHDASPDQVDAILRDPNVPGDVRAAAVVHYAVTSYLARVEFVTDDNGVTNVQARDDAGA
jgi:hypothetical protein